MKPDKRCRVFLGGSWVESFTECVRAAFLVVIKPSYRNSDLGFRTHLTGRLPRV